MRPARVVRRRPSWVSMSMTQIKRMSFMVSVTSCLEDENALGVDALEDGHLAVFAVDSCEHCHVVVGVEGLVIRVPGGHVADLFVFGDGGGVGVDALQAIGCAARQAVLLFELS